MRGFADHIRRFSLSSRPTLSDMSSALPEERGGPENAATMDTGGPPDTGGCNEGPTAKKRKQFNKAGNTRKKPKLEPAPAHVKPDWMPPLDSPWTDVLQVHPELTETHPSDPILYAFPPLHMFYIPDPEALAMRVHNWLRIRMWCISEVFNALNDRRVLMTTTQWRFVLMGKFFRHPFSDCGTGIALKSKPAEIAQLLPHPDPDESHSRHLSDIGKKPKAALRRPVQRSDDMLDIAVRFGVRGRFPPWDQSQVVFWCSQPTTYADISSNLTSYVKTMAWELSILHFRVDLLNADRRVLKEIYQSGDNDLIMKREDALKSVWDDHGRSMRPCWEDGEPADALAGPFGERARAFARLAQALGHWPEAKERLPSVQLTQRVMDSLEGDIVARTFMGSVCVAYSEFFHTLFGRLPTFPPEMPGHLYPDR